MCYRRETEFKQFLKLKYAFTARYSDACGFIIFYMKPQAQLSVMPNAIAFGFFTPVNERMTFHFRLVKEKN